MPSLAATTSSLLSHWMSFKVYMTRLRMVVRSAPCPTRSLCKPSIAGLPIIITDEHTCRGAHTHTHIEGLDVGITQQVDHI